MNGTDACRRVREHERACGVRPSTIIITSGSSSRRNLLEYAASGADGLVRIARASFRLATRPDCTSLDAVCCVSSRPGHLQPAYYSDYRLLNESNPQMLKPLDISALLGDMEALMRVRESLIIICSDVLLT